MRVGARRVLQESVNPIFDEIFIAIVATAFIFSLVRFGPLAICVGTLLLERSDSLPMTLDLSLWHSGGFLVLSLITAALLACGFLLCLAGRSMFAEGTLDG